MRVLWLLEELGLEFDYDPAAPRSAAVCALNRSGKIPVLVDGTAALTDSTAIMTYLADKMGKFTFPAGTVERARQDGHTCFLLDEFDACIWTAARHTFILPEKHRLPQIKDSLRWEFERSQKLFADRLGEKEFLMGDKVTVPDFIAAHCGYWAKVANFPISEPAFADHTARMLSRPAYLRAAAR